MEATKREEQPPTPDCLSQSQREKTMTLTHPAHFQNVFWQHQGESQGKWEEQCSSSQKLPETGESIRSEGLDLI